MNYIGNANSKKYESQELVSGVLRLPFIDSVDSVTDDPCKYHAVEELPVMGIAKRGFENVGQPGSHTANDRRANGLSRDFSSAVILVYRRQQRRASGRCSMVCRAVRHFTAPCGHP